MKKVLWGIILLLIIIILSSPIIYLELQKDSSSEKEPEEELDAKISPLENQGLILQINRIRHRGLLDKLMTPGSSWKIQPRFYFISNIDIF